MGEFASLNQIPKSPRRQHVHWENFHKYKGEFDVGWKFSLIKRLNYKNKPAKNTRLKITKLAYIKYLLLGNPSVDYLSLDVEGAELGVLATVPWEKVDIK